MQKLSHEEIVHAALKVSYNKLLRQHELVVRLGMKSLEATDFQDLLIHVCETAAIGMGSHFAQVLVPVPSESLFLLSSGVGWKLADIGVATILPNEGSPAGYGFATNRPIISNGLGCEARFKSPALYDGYGIERVINVPIRGLAGLYGVLEVCSESGDDFIESDIVFLEGLANIVSLAIERRAIYLEAQRAQAYSESVLSASPDGVKILSRDGLVEFFSTTGLSRIQIANLYNVKGMLWSDLWPDNSKALVKDAISRVVAGESVRFETFCPSAKGEPRWWDVTVAPIFDKEGHIDRIIAVSRDVTEHHDQEASLSAMLEAQDAKLAETGLRLGEIHHRIKNSLHLVNSLLLLQANLSVDEVVRNQLKTAANRVVAVATVHERLCHDTESDNAGPSQYLSALLADIGNAFSERAITLEVNSFLLPVKRIAPLGLIVSELVTNALKYGSGAIFVQVKGDGDDAAIMVTDKGDGPAESCNRPRGTGLGMRLVKSYSGYNDQAIIVDRSNGVSTVKVRFKL